MRFRVVVAVDILKIRFENTGNIGFVIGALNAIYMRTFILRYALPVSPKAMKIFINQVIPQNLTPFLGNNSTAPTELSFVFVMTVFLLLKGGTGSRSSVT